MVGFTVPEVYVDYVVVVDAIGDPNGIVSGIAATKHAINFTATDGREILVHVGIDTVSLNGRGFTVLVQEGAAVSKGDIVMEVDLDVIRAAGLSPIVVVAE